MKFKSSKITANAAWIIFSKIIQMLLSFAVSLLTARYLGPSNYGLINYASTYTAFFSSLCNLGIDSILVNEYLCNPEKQGETTGSTLVLQTISSMLSIICIWSIVSIVDRGEPLTILVCSIYSFLLLFRAFDVLRYWFQSRYESKYPSIASTIALVMVAVYRIVCLIRGKSILWFAVTNSLDNIVVAAFLFFIYKKKGGPKLSFSLTRAKHLLGQSYHFILSSLMVAIYGYTDKLMLKQMLGTAEVGYYSTATAICAMWTFILEAIIQSFRPEIIETRKSNIESYKKKLRFLFAIVFYVSIIVAIGISALAKFIVLILYGESYLHAVPCLQVVTWYTAFSYLGVSRNIWIVCESRQKWLKYIYLVATIGNIALNLLLIPVWGGVGAAFASLITQMCTSIVIPLFFKDMRESSKLMLDGIFLRNLR